MPTVTETRNSAPTWVYAALVGAVVILAVVFFALRPSHVKPGSAQVDAKNTESRMQVCYIETKDFTRCDSDSELDGNDAKLVRGTRPKDGEVAIRAKTDSYRITAADSENQLWMIFGGLESEHGAGICLTRADDPCASGPRW
jgi:hypothetical protein